MGIIIYFPANFSVLMRLAHINSKLLNLPFFLFLVMYQLYLRKFIYICIFVFELILSLVIEVDLVTENLARNLNLPSLQIMIVG